MGVQVFNIGSSTTVVGGAVTITIGAGGVPAGAHTFVAVSWNATITQPTVADTAGNTYLIGSPGGVQANNNVAANGAGGVFRQRTGLALVNGNTITVTLGGTATLAAVDAFYVTGLLNVGADTTGAYNTAFGSSTTPSVTSGVPVRQGELFVAIVTGATLITSFTQDTTNAAWGTSAPAGSISNAAPVLGVGFVVNTGVGTLTYAPTFGTSDAWAATVIGYSAIPVWGFDGLSLGGSVDVPRSVNVLRSRATVARGRSEFGIFPNLQPMGWEVQPVQPPHPRPERSAATARGHDGIDDIRRVWVNRGEEVQPVQPPHPRVEKSGAIICDDLPDDGADNLPQSRFVPFTPIEQPQPPHPRSERAGAVMRGDDGTQAPFAVWRNGGWEYVPPHLLPRFYPAGKGVPNSGDDGIQAPPVPSQVINWGWEQQSTAQRLFRPFTVLRTANDDSFAAFPWVNVGYEVQSVQPPHPRPERSGAVQVGDSGMQAPFITPQTVWGYEQQLVARRSLRLITVLRTVNDDSFAAFPWVNVGYEVQSVQPPRPRSERSGAVQVGDTGTEAALVSPAVAVNWGFEQQQHFVYKLRRGAAIEGTSEFLTPTPPVYGWDVQYTDLPHPRPERSGAVMVGDQGTQAVLSAIPIPLLYPGWESVSAMTYHPRPERTAALMRGDDGTQAALINWRNAGYEVQSVQPPHPMPERRSAAVMRGDDGTQGTLTQFVQFGWPIQLPQPPHPRSERSGAVQVGDSGTQAPYVFLAIPLANGWDYLTSAYTAHPRPERSGAIARGDEGSYAALINWRTVGYEVQAVQPPHPRPERSGSIALGDAGTEAPFVFVAPPVVGWETQPVQPPHPRPEQRAAATLRGDDGTQAAFYAWRSAGYEIQSVQPSHPRPERAGSIMLGDGGIAARYVFASPPVVGWDVQALQPPHRAPEYRGGALMRGDDGTQGTLTNWLVDGWAVQPVQPPHPRPERSGTVARGEDGIEAAFVPPVFVPITWWDTPPAALKRPLIAARFDVFFGSTGWEGVPIMVTLAIGNRGQIYSALSGGMETIGGF